jgi:hypothetical protein
MAGNNFFRRIGVLTPLAVLLFILVLVNVFLSLANQSLRLQVNESQQFITQSMQLEGLNREILLTLATIAVKDNDPQLKNLLASQGLKLIDPGAAGGEK